ncbi:MAG: gamma-glutamylcyclotransferase [Gammaproteobacteria bacterium]|nr:gamma-glutamylcyclotransferase [Gammaproteobacteria bacterium]
MSTPRISRRIQSATVLSSACLAGHCLRFRKKSVDGSAKCDIEHTQAGGDRVHGVIYEIPVREKTVLDRYEGLGNGYEDRQVSVVVPGGDTIIANTYFATHIDASLKPFHWYKEHVLRGAREHVLPDEYIAAIEAVHAIDDPDMDNHAAELSIYSS